MRWNSILAKTCANMQAQDKVVLSAAVTFNRFNGGLSRSNKMNSGLKNGNPSPSLVFIDQAASTQGCLRIQNLAALRISRFAVLEPLTCESGCDLGNNNPQGS